MKIFGIGLNKTGGFSLHRALNQLGYNSIYNASICKNITESLKKGITPEDIDKYDSFIDYSDCPYKDILEKYPDSKFILTTRPLEDWIRSRIVQVLYNRVFDSNPWKNIDIVGWERIYNQHHQKVEDFFKDKNNLLVMDICGGDGWEKLCNFLEIQSPKTTFPKTKSIKDNIDEINQFYSYKDSITFDFFVNEVKGSLPQKRVKNNICGRFTIDDCSVIVTCKGRSSHLKETIISQVSMGAGEYILVDYEDPDKCGKWTKELYGDHITVVKPKAINPPYFNLSHARNCAAKIAKGKILVFIDADIKPDINWLQHIVDIFNKNDETILVRSKHEYPHWEKSGTCAVISDVFHTVDGYRESIDRWGSEDIDLYNRLEQVGVSEQYNPELLSIIEHDDKLRTENYPEPDKIESGRQMREFVSKTEGNVNPEGWGRLDPFEKGVLTAANSEYFDGVKLLFKSIQETEKYPFRCINLGLTNAQLNWCRNNALKIIELDDDIPETILDSFKKKKKISSIIQQENLLWIRPWLIAKSPFRDTIWIDADAIVLEPLEELFSMIEGGLVVFADANNPGDSPNKPELYKYLPVNNVTDKYVNSGVLGIRKERDDDLVYWWKYCVEKAAKSEDIRKYISWHDQGSLLWALHKTDRTDLISFSTKWNHPPNGYDHKEVQKRKMYKKETLLQSIKEDHPDVGIVHYMSTIKLWDLVY